jgi:hypothetical protein
MSHKVFSLQEASELLPELTELLRTIRHSHGRVLSLRDRISVLDLIGATEPRSPEHREYVERKLEFDSQVSRFNGRLRRVQEIGCIVKDVHQGLVDFYCVHDGRLIFLCWMLGEKEIGYWHEIDSGFTGRRPVSELKLKN